MKKTKNQRFLSCPNRRRHLNKRGFLLAETTVKIIIAVIALGFLIYLLTSLYFSKVEAQKLKHANEILLYSTGSLNQKINELEEGGSEEFVLSNPTGWYFFSFTGAHPPIKCGGASCVCICDETWFESDQAGECHENGACLVIPYFSSPEKDLKIYISSGENVPTLKISKIGRLIHIEEK